VLLALADDLRSESSGGALLEEFIIILLNVDLLLAVFNLLHCDVASLLKPIGDLQGMDTLVQKLLSLLKQSTGQHNNSCSSVSNLVILGFRQLH
jgi:hypothetical protein